MQWILTGFTHSGKSFLGARLAAQLGLRFIDTDFLLRQVLDPNGMRSCRELYQELGREDFRAQETELLHHPEVLEADIVGTGGGMGICEFGMGELAQRGTVLYLETSWDLIRRRMSTLPGFVATWDCLQKEHIRRHPMYLKHADHVLFQDLQTKHCLVRELVTLITRTGNGQ